MQDSGSVSQLDLTGRLAAHIATACTYVMWLWHVSHDYHMHVTWLPCVCCMPDSHNVMPARHKTITCMSHDCPSPQSPTRVTLVQFTVYATRQTARCMCLDLRTVPSVCGSIQLAWHTDSGKALRGGVGVGLSRHRWDRIAGGRSWCCMAMHRNGLVDNLLCLIIDHSSCNESILVALAFDPVSVMKEYSHNYVQECMRGRGARDHGLSMLLFGLYSDECLSGYKIGPVYIQHVLKLSTVCSNSYTYAPLHFLQMTTQLNCKYIWNCLSFLN